MSAKNRHERVLAQARQAEKQAAKLRQLAFRQDWLKTQEAYLAACAIAILTVALPILLFPIPPLLDYPAHLARQGIIHDLLTAGTFSTMYRLHFAVIPNLGMEAIVQPLLFLGVPLEIAGRLFLVLIVVVLGSGIVNLHRALFRTTSYFPLLAFPFIFNRIFIFGFLNYLLGAGLALHAFAWWLRNRQRRVSAILPILLSWTVVLFFCHLMAAALIVGLIASYETALMLVERYNGKERSFNLPRALMLLGVSVALLAFLYRLAPLSAVPRTEVYSFGEALREIPLRLKALPSNWTAYSRPVDVVVMLALAGLLGLSVWFRRLRLSWPMLAPISGLLLAYALVPQDWAGTAYIAERLPVIVMFLFFSSVDIAGDGRNLSAIVAAGILALRTAAVVIAWSRADAQYRPMLQAMEKLPAHSAIYTGINYRETFEPLLLMPWAHFEAYAAIHNRLYVQGVWADPSQDWIVPTPRYEMLSNFKLHYNRVDRPGIARHVSDMFDPTLLAGDDFLLAIQPELYQRPFPPGVRLMLRSGAAALYSLHNR